MKKDSVSVAIKRRAVLAGTGAAVLSLAMPAIVGRARAQSNDFAGKELRVLTWADATGQAALRNIMRTFEAETGARVIPDLTGTTSEMIARIRASAARPDHDIVILSSFGAIELANAGLLETPELNRIPNLSDVFEEYRSGADGYGVGYFLWSDGLVYSTQTFDAPPRSFEVLWDERSDGRIFAPPPDNMMAMELIIVAARMAGGSQSDPEAGFDLLRRLKPRLLTLSSNAGQIADLFRAGSLDAGGVYSPLELADFIPQPEYNVSGTYDLEEGFFADLQFMVMPRGHPGDSEVAHAFMNHALDPSVQAQMAEDVWYGPINSATQLSEAALSSPYIASPDVIASRAVEVDMEHLASVRSDWTRRYAEALAD